MWSPDGEFIYYARRTTAATESDIYRHPADGGTALPIIGHLSATNEFQPEISPNGKRLCYTFGAFGAPAARLSSLTSPALVEDRRQRALDAAAARLLLELEAVRTLAGERAGLAVVLDDADELAGLGHGVEAEHLDRLGRPRRLDALARVVGHRAHAAPVGAGDDRVADLQRAALDEHGDDRAAARIELGLDHGAGGIGVRVGGELLDLGGQQQALEQVVEPLRASWPRRRRTSCRRPTPRAGARAGSSRCGRGRAARLPCRSC